MAKGSNKLYLRHDEKITYDRFQCASSSGSPQRRVDAGANCYPSMKCILLNSKIVEHSCWNGYLPSLRNGTM